MSGQPHMHQQFNQLQQQLLYHDNSNGHNFAIGYSSVSAPRSSSFSVGSDFLASTVAPEVSTITHPATLAYRPIRPSDLEVLREIHEALFPIKYELEFFNNVVHGRGIISWAAVDASRSSEQADELIGFVTARIVAATDSEEAEMLGYDLVKSERTLIYISTLGVTKPYRSQGIASALIREVITYATRLQTCRAVYLHVISYNHSAILFYKKNNFQCLRRLRNFYYISGHHYDSFLYIYYVNGGRSPCTAIDMLSSASAFVRSLFNSLVTKLFWKGQQNGRDLKFSKCGEVCGPLCRSPSHRHHIPDKSCV